MKRKWWIVAVSVFVVLAVAILVRSEPGSDISPSAKVQIDRLAAEHDCVGLQMWFDATTNDAPRQLTYIDDKMRGAGCYDD